MARGPFALVRVPPCGNSSDASAPATAEPPLAAAGYLSSTTFLDSSCVPASALTK